MNVRRVYVCRVVFHNIQPTRNRPQKNQSRLYTPIIEILTNVALRLTCNYSVILRFNYIVKAADYVRISALYMYGVLVKLIKAVVCLRLCLFVGVKGLLCRLNDFCSLGFADPFELECPRCVRADL